MGSTGKSTGVHLDLAVYPGDRATNKSVSPLPITEQTRILFGGWATQWDTQWFNMNKEWLYKDYLSSYNLPSDSKLKAMKLTPDQFMAEANNYRASQWWKFETKEQQEEITKLRKEFDSLPEIKDYNKVKQMYTTVSNASKLWTAAWDLSLIFAYMKILDPWSTVREWEFANAQNAWWVEDKVRNAYNKAMKWTRLSDRQRQDFANTAEILYKWYENTYREKINTIPMIFYIMMRY